MFSGARYLQHLQPSPLAGYSSSRGVSRDMKNVEEKTLLAYSSAPPAQKESLLGKFLISASVAWLFEAFGGHFIEFLKIVKQTKKGTYLQLTKEMVAQKGIVGVWDGFIPWGTVQAVAKGGVFGFGHSLSKDLLRPLVDKGFIGKGTWEVLSGGLGGGFQGLVLSPTLLLKTRVMTDPVFRTKMSLAETSKQSLIVGVRVMKNEGFAGLMKGSLVFSSKRVADWMTRFFFAEGTETVLRSMHPETPLTVWEKTFSSLMGGTLSALSTLPIDVMVAQIQQASKAGQNVSVLETFKAQYKEGGIKQITDFATRGFVARVVHVALTTALMKTGTEQAYLLVYGHKPKGH